MILGIFDMSYSGMPRYVLRCGYDSEQSARHTLRLYIACVAGCETTTNAGKVKACVRELEEPRDVLMP